MKSCPLSCMQFSMWLCSRTAMIKLQLLTHLCVVWRWWGLSFEFLSYETSIKKHLVNIVSFPFAQNQQTLILPSSRFFLPLLSGQFEAVTLRQHQRLYKRKWQEQDVQIISNARGAVPRHVSLHSWVLTWGLRARVWAFHGPRVLMCFVGAGGKGPKSFSRDSNENIHSKPTTWA